MADINTATVFVLHQEDASMSGITTNATNDHGGRTRWGIAENAHPELSATGFFATMSNEASLATAEQVYAKDYALPLCLNELDNQAVANCCLSFAINEGVKPAARVIQEAVNLCRASVIVPRLAAITVDGQIGNQTITAINAINPRDMLNALRLQQRDHYVAIITADPTQAKWQHGWFNRVDADTIGQAV